MNNLLRVDLNTFISKFPDAHKYLTAAHLRYEAQYLLFQLNRTSWENERLKEILKTPACNENWFKKMIGGRR